MSLIWGSPRYAAQWPKSGMICNGELYQLRPWERPIFGGDGLQLPTPTTKDYSYQKGLGKNAQKRYSLQAMARREMLPTPTAATGHQTPTSPCQWGRHLKIGRQCLNVATAIQEGYTQKTIGKDSRLNPAFVEEMMGFPIGWTALDP